MYVHARLELDLGAVALPMVACLPQGVGAGCPERLWMPHPGGIQSKAGCGSGQPSLVVGNPAHSRGLETR